MSSESPKRQFVTSACEFLLPFEQLEPSLQPLFSCSSLVCGHCPRLLPSHSRCVFVFDCPALYLARGMEGVGVTGVTGFVWTR